MKGRGKMNIKNIKYEMRNMKYIIIDFIRFLIPTYLLILFSFVFMFKYSDDNNITNTTSYIDFCIILILCISSVYGSAKSCGSVVSEYMNDNKIRLYMLPNGRGSLFLNKVLSFSLLFSGIYSVCIALCSVIFLVINYFYHFINISNNYLCVLLVFISSSILLMSMLISSISFGIRYKSKVRTIIFSVLLTCIMCNLLLAVTLMSSYLLFGLSIFAFVASYFYMKHIKKYINNEDI